MRPPQRRDEYFQKSTVRIFGCRNPPEATQSAAETTVPPAPADEACWDLCWTVADCAKTSRHYHAYFNLRRSPEQPEATAEAVASASKRTTADHALDASLVAEWHLLKNRHNRSSLMILQAACM